MERCGQLRDSPETRSAALVEPLRYICDADTRELLQGRFQTKPGKAGFALPLVFGQQPSLSQENTGRSASTGHPRYDAPIKKT
jgi:hypothetical protein